MKDDNANELLQDDVTIGDVAIGLYAQAILCYLLKSKILCDESFCDARGGYNNASGNYKYYS